MDGVEGEGNFYADFQAVNYPVANPCLFPGNVFPLRQCLCQLAFAAA